MQDPNEDTEWNDILRSRGIIPPKEKEISENDIVNLVEETVTEKTKDSKNLEEYSLDELDLIEDEEDERVIQEYRHKRMLELKAAAQVCRYGSLEEISGHEYINEVNKAGDGVWVVLHLYKPGIPLCSLLNEHLKNLAMRFRSTKFLKSISTTCIPNYPDSKLPAVFVYLEGEMKSQIIGASEFRHADISVEELEWMLGKIGAIKTDIKDDPRPKPKDVLFSSLMASKAEDDW